MRLALFAYGFRPLFLAAALTAAVLVPWWAAILTLGLPPPTDWAVGLWHGHEMLFGFIGAALGGFLLTAVPSWTGARGFAGRPLAAVVALWLLARVLVAAAARVPFMLVALVDLAYLPALAALIAPPILRSRNRNVPLLGVLALLWLCDAAFFHGVARDDAVSASRALTVGIDVMLVLVTIIGGRIVPSFTANALKAARIPWTQRTWPALTPAAVVLMLAVAVTDVLSPGRPVAGVAALCAAVVQGVRMLQWGGLRTRGLPIVWILHVAYAWLPIGLLLKGLALVAGMAVGVYWLHALTVGALTTMIVAVMTRASLGHTGRPLTAPRTILVAYGLLIVTAVVRVFGPIVAGGAYRWVIAIAAATWLGAFALFLWVYVPILCLPRLDGRPG